MKVTIKQIINASDALKRLADNAKLPTVLYIRVVRAWKAIISEIDTYSKAQQGAIDRHHKFIEVKDAQGNPSNAAQFKSFEDGIAYRAEVEAALADEVELTIKPIAWSSIEEAIEAKSLEISPADVAALDWLIEGLPEE